MDRSTGILKNTLKFMIAFVVITLIFIFLWALLLSTVPTGTSAYKYAPISNKVDPETLDWDSITGIKGTGAVLNDEGEVIQSFGDYVGKEHLTMPELLDFFNLRTRRETVFVYDTTDGNKLLLIYPKNVFKATPTLNVDSVMGEDAKYFSLVLFGGLVLYLFFIFLLIKRLSRRLKEEEMAIRREEETRKNLFVRGLAHDIKTPLATIISYSKALNDGIVKEKEEKNYYRTISRNGIILNERVEDMMNLIVLDDQNIFKPERGDILESVRRFVGENYTWIVEKGGNIDIRFGDDERFVTDYDPNLFDRMLQNLLQNSIHHNEKGVRISINWDHKNTLIIEDDGVGIPEDIRDNMWDPMVTGDKSRAGDKLRGMGLANVKRIVELHNWEVKYDKKFMITM